MEGLGLQFILKGGDLIKRMSEVACFIYGGRWPKLHVEEGGLTYIWRGEA